MAAVVRIGRGGIGGGDCEEDEWRVRIVVRISLVVVLQSIRRVAMSASVGK